ECEGMGQISMKISALPGSVLSENQQSICLSRDAPLFSGKQKHHEIFRSCDQGRGLTGGLPAAAERTGLSEMIKIYSDIS
ncbi:hypothetical protein, partial [Gluconacetobacter entanii]